MTNTTEREALAALSRKLRTEQLTFKEKHSLADALDAIAAMPASPVGQPVACETCAKLDPRMESVSARLARQAGGKFVCRECGRDYSPQRAEAYPAATVNALDDAVQAETYRQMHETAQEMGYSDILTALEALDALRSGSTVNALVEAVRKYQRLLMPVNMIFADMEMSDDPVPDDVSIFSSIGCTTSTSTTARDFRDADKTATEALALVGGVSA